MDQVKMNLMPSRFSEHPAIDVAGLSQRYNRQTKHQIPALWQRFVPYLGSIPGRCGGTSFGLCHNYGADGSFDYLCGVHVAGSPTLPAQLTTVKIPRKTYAVFSHTGHISNLHLMWQAIFSEWLPVSGCTLEEEPNFEVYTDRFDPRSGTGLVEIWIPLKEGIAA
jgi:AraC family transcriptional regulator